jgi:HEAT repeat protein
MSENLVSFSSLVDWAQNQQWEQVDAYLSRFTTLDETQSAKVLHWVRSIGLQNEDQDIRDLAVSMIEQIRVQIPEDIVGHLIIMMETDPNIYVQYRCAFALFVHGSREDVVIQKLEEARTDEEVAEIAQKYLSGLAMEKTL